MTVTLRLKVTSMVSPTVTPQLVSTSMKSAAVMIGRTSPPMSAAVPDALVDEIGAGEIGLLENLRFDPREKQNDADFAESCCHVEIEREYHASFRDLMTGLKRIGAQNTSRERPTGLFPRQVMQEMKQLYNAEYLTENGVQASYGVLYGVASKEN